VGVMVRQFYVLVLLYTQLQILMCLITSLPIQPEKGAVGVLNNISVV
jgi:hypothetical protein